jgi:hypothetical protein
MQEVAFNLVPLSLIGFGSPFDVIALVVFIAMAVIYVLAPVFGYQSRRRSAMAFALYALLGIAGVGLAQMFLQWLLIAEVIQEPDAFKNAPRPFNIEGPGRLSLLLLLSFAMMKMLLLFAALLSFVVGLQQLRLRPPEVPVEDNARGE